MRAPSSASFGEDEWEDEKTRIIHRPVLRSHTVPDEALAWTPPGVVVTQAPATRSRDRVGPVAAVLGMLSILLTAVLTVFLLHSRDGHLRVELAARDGSRIQRAEIFVDGRKECDVAPCRLSIPRGSRNIKVMAAGFERPEPVVANVVPGKEQVIVIPLEPVAPTNDADQASRAPIAQRSEPTATQRPHRVANRSGLRAASRGPSPASSPNAAHADPQDDETDSADEPVGTGTLTLSSNPPAKVLLDGEALGNTPRANVGVPAGTHTVTFIHPDLGKRSISVEVAPDAAATAAVDFTH